MPTAKSENQVTIKAGPGQGRPWASFVGTPFNQGKDIIEFFGLGSEAEGKSPAELAIMATLIFDGLFDQHLRQVGTGAEVQDLPADVAEEPAPKKASRRDKVSRALRAVAANPEATIEDLRQVYRDNPDLWDGDVHGVLADEVKTERGWVDG